MNEMQTTLKDHSYAWHNEVKAAWNQGNDDGDGFAVGESHHRPVEAAESEDYTILSNDGDGQPVVCADGERVIAICDANGPWAVDITDDIANAMAGEDDDEEEEGGHRVIAPATFGTHPSMGSDGRYEFDCAHCGDAVQYTGARLDNDYFEAGERVGYHDPVTGEDFCTDCEAKLYGSDDEEAEDE